MAERRIWRAVDADLFRFTTTDLRDLHLALMSAFEEAAVLSPALNLEQVHLVLPDVGWDDTVDDEVLQRALASLVGWGLLEATQDHGAHYATPEEFERRNLQWALTERGEAAIGGVLHAVDALRHAVGLQPAILDAIGDGLHELTVLLALGASSDTDARIHIQLAEIENHMAGLVTSVRQFNGHLQRLLRDDATDDEVFADVKRRTVAYLEEYVHNVERPQRRLAAVLTQLHEIGLPTLFDRALAGANLAPVSGDDPGPDWLGERARRWHALQVWFNPADATSPRINGLLDIARTAIIELLRVLERRWDSRRRSASVAADFRQLAAWFAAAPGDDDAHRLFGAAFGMWSSRHAHLVGPDDDVGPSTSWLVADVVEVAPALRTSGSLQQRGRPRSVEDPARLRELRQRMAAHELAAHDEVRAALFTDGQVRLSSFPTLSGEQLQELLNLLSTALDAAASPSGERHALSVDGAVEIVITDPGDGRRTRLESHDGVLDSPDFHVTITRTHLVAPAEPPPPPASELPSEDDLEPHLVGAGTPHG